MNKGLSPDRITQAKRLVYACAVWTFSKDEVIQPAEAEQLSTIRTVLDLSVSDVAEIDLHLEQQQALWRLKRGELPEINLPIPLKGREVGHFSFHPVEFHQERVVHRGYEGGSQGVSLRIARGVSYRVGGHRGQLVSRTAITWLDSGALYLTSQRLIFSGPKRSFSIGRGKILNVSVYADGFSIVRDSIAVNNKPFYFLYTDMEHMGTALSAWLDSVG